MSPLDIQSFLLSALADRGLSQADFVRLSGVSETMVSRNLHSRKDPRWLRTARALLTVADADVVIATAPKRGPRGDLLAEIQSTICEYGTANDLAGLTGVSWATAARWMANDVYTNASINSHIKPWQAMLAAVGHRLSVTGNER